MPSHPSSTAAAAARHAIREEEQRARKARERRNKAITLSVCVFVFFALAGTTTYLLFTVKG
ncbi:hypothetical protein [Streptomyces sp. NPDC056191]|uniref:hypothetical protein n=1 Tax=Streptomyces sp. NPDC056191 TaxID=3345742 RepID=UPI0035E18223